MAPPCEASSALTQVGPPPEPDAVEGPDRAAFRRRFVVWNGGCLPGRSVMPSRLPLAFTFALGLTACGARSPLEIGELADAGPADACAIIPCPSARHFDPRSCSCVPDACAPVPCPSSHHFDAQTCACVPDGCADAPAGPVTLASTKPPEFGTAIAVHGDYVYWTVRNLDHEANGSVRRVPRCGGPVTVLAPNQVGPVSVAVGGRMLFWGNMGRGIHTPGGALMRMPLGGGPVTQIASQTVFWKAIATDQSYVYWTSETTLHGAYRAPIAGGPTEAIGPNQVFNEIAVDKNRAYLSQPASIPSNSRVVSMPLGGGPLKVLVPSDLVFPGVIAIDDTSVYYESRPDKLMRVDKNGGTPQTIATAPLSDMAVDASHVYWVQGDAARSIPYALERVGKSGGTPTRLSDKGGTAIALDDSYVYWISVGDVLRMKK